MNVLIGCEYSGRTREAFRKLGNNAWSCDLLESEDNSPYHIVGDVFDVINSQHWDLMIAHPPCTYLANSGERWMKNNPERQELRVAAKDFVIKLFQSDIEKIVIENPIGHLSTAWKKPDQIIQPFHHGHEDWKSTCLWLKNLPLLLPTNIVEPEKKLCGGLKPGRISSRLHRLPPSPDRWRERSRTYQGIANAFADQYGK